MLSYVPTRMNISILQLSIPELLNVVVVWLIVSISKAVRFLRVME